MTTIKFRSRPVWHETALRYEGRPLLVAESPGALLLRKKGTRQVVALPWSIAYLRGCQLIAEWRKGQARKHRQVRRGALA